MLIGPGCEPTHTAQEHLSQGMLEIMRSYIQRRTALPSQDTTPHRSDPDSARSQPAVPAPRANAKNTVVIQNERASQTLSIAINLPE